MRNSIICIILAFVVITTFGFFELVYLKKLSNELIYDIDTIVYEESFDNKILDFTKFREKWGKHQKILSMLIDHQDIHKIESRLVEIDMILKNNFSSSQISTNFALLKLYIKDVVDEREFNLKNVL